MQKIMKNLKARWPLLIICGFIIGGFYWSLTRHYVTSVNAAKPDLIYTIESQLLDLRFNLRGAVKTTGQVGILAIDEESIMRFGDWPFSRKYFAQALVNLKKLGVRFVGFDMMFPDPQIARLDDVRADLKSAMRGLQSGNRAAARKDIEGIEKWLIHSPGDMQLAKAVADTKFAILGVAYYASRREATANLGKDPKNHFRYSEQLDNSYVPIDMPEGFTLDRFSSINKAYGIKNNLPLIGNAAQHVGFFNNDSDNDAVNRWVSLIANVNDNVLPALALRTAAEHLNSDILVVANGLGVETIILADRTNSEKSVEVVTDPYGAGRILVNHRGPGKTFRHFAVSRAYDNSYTAEERKALRGMSLLVGGTAQGTQDLRPNPYDSQIDGVENHAAVVDNIIRGDFLRRDLKMFQTEKMMVLLVGLIFAPLMIWGSAMISGISMLCFLAGYWYFDWTFWFSKGVWAYIAVPSVEILTLFVCTTFYKYFTEERDKKVVKGAFQFYLSPDVIDQLLEDPANIGLGGVKRDITIFFSDLRNFTTISEGLAPEKLSEFLNQYFTPMTDSVLRTGGTVDKFIGDAIMAFWGAPLTTADHPSRAAETCLEMMYILDKLQHDLPAKGFPKPDIGIGLNSSHASVGNMGSNARFSYTAIGDGVNLAARLEGLTKDYGIKILISEFTAARLPEKFYRRDLDDIRVKGKNEPVKVFELVRPDLLANETLLKDFIGEFEAGRLAYKAKNWLKAEQHFMKCFMLRSGDGPTSLYMKRVSEFKAQDPGNDWDGVYTFKHK